MNIEFDLNLFSSSSMSKVRRTFFAKYEKNVLRDKFVQSSTCNKFGSLLKAAHGTSVEPLSKKILSDHWTTQTAYCDLYYANEYRSMAYPWEVRTITHHNMDHVNTTCLLFSQKTKINDTWMNLLVYVTGMIACQH